MNSLKQNLDNALDSLELTPAMEAEILMNASAPARKTRRRSRAVIAALLVVCLLSITGPGCCSPRGDPLKMKIATAERHAPNMLLLQRGAYYGACLHPMQCNPLHLASKIRGPDVPSGLPEATLTCSA